MLRILVVDDEPSIATTLKMIFEKHGYEARHAVSGEEALVIAEDFRPDICVTDYAMPRMNGFEFGTKLVKMLPGCRLFLLTACLQLAELTGPERRPEFVILSKPIAIPDLLASVAFPDFVATPKPPVVLNVDDVEIHRYSITRLLKKHGFIVVEAASGTEALQMLGESIPDAVLLDVNLPDLDGFEVCRNIRRAGMSMPVIHFTATYRDPRGPALSQEAGANNYIEQPVPPDTLVKRLREVVQQGYLADETVFSPTPGVPDQTQELS